MTGIEFKNKVDEFLTNKNITVAEHEKMFRELKSVAMKTFKKFLDKYLNYVKAKYAPDEDGWGLDSECVYNVEFHTDAMSFVYWDDSCQETSSCVSIPMDDFIKWIDGDVASVQEFIIKDIIETLTDNLAYDKRRIEYYKAAVENTEKFLANMGKMKFKDIKKWYDNWVENSI